MDVCLSGQSKGLRGRTLGQLFSSRIKQLQDLGYASLFDTYGIGGLRDWQQIRCLHMQYAHHLCGENVIGQWLDQHYGLSELVISI